jgi:predicted nucleotidyltransferase
MSVNSGFDDLQATVNASPESLKEARRRRDVFRAALGGAADIVEIIPTGSVARGTQRDPIHDVDLVAVFDAESHDNWGTPGDSAEAALEHTRGRVKDLLGSSGSHSEEVRFTRLNNHSLKCFLDNPEDTDPFTVDVTPALRQAGGVLLIPERLNREWILSNPEHLNGEVARRHAEWNQFARLVRVLRRWNTDQGKVMKPLVIEVLALTHLPVDDRPQALKRFFAAARTAVLSPVCDPAGLCGEIQPDLDRQKASDLLAAAADLAWRAVYADEQDKGATAMCLWNQVFGDIYPEPICGCSGSGAATTAATAAAGLAVTTAAPKRPIRDAPQG